MTALYSAQQKSKLARPYIALQLSMQAEDYNLIPKTAWRAAIFTGSALEVEVDILSQWRHLFPLSQQWDTLGLEGRKVSYFIKTDHRYSSMLWHSGSCGFKWYLALRLWHAKSSYTRQGPNQERKSVWISGGKRLRMILKLWYTVLVCNNVCINCMCQGGPRVWAQGRIQNFKTRKGQIVKTETWRLRARSAKP